MRPFINVGEGFRFISIVIQLGLIVLALWRYRIETSQRFQYLLPLIFFGFIVHHLLPERYRRAFFLALSLAGIMLVLPFPHSLVLIAMALGLVGLCHLPISLRARVGLILLTGVTLAAVRAGWLSDSDARRTPAGDPARACRNVHVPARYLPLRSVA